MCFFIYILVYQDEKDPSSSSDSDVGFISSGDEVLVDLMGPILSSKKRPRKRQKKAGAKFVKRLRSSGEDEELSLQASKKTRKKKTQDQGDHNALLSSLGGVGETGDDGGKEMKVKVSRKARTRKNKSK